MRTLSRVNGLGEITWADRTQNRVIDAGLSIPFGFGIGLLMALVLPRPGARGMFLTGAALLGGLSAASAMLPVDGKVIDGVSKISGALAGASLAHAAVGR